MEKEKYALAGHHMLKNLFTVSCPVINTQFKRTTEEMRWVKRILIYSCVPKGQHTFKWTVHPKTKILTSLTHPHVILNLSDTKGHIFHHQITSEN